MLAPTEKNLPNTENSDLLIFREADSFSEWKSFMGNRFGPVSVSTTANSFHGHIRSRSIYDATVTEVVASPHKVRRVENQTGETHQKLLKLSLLLDGSGLVAQDGRTAILSSGDVAIYDTSRPYLLEFTRDIRLLIIIFPLNLINVPSSYLKQITAVRLGGDVGIGTVIIPFMEHIATNLHLLNGVDGERILHSTFDLISALLSAELSKEKTTLHNDQSLQIDDVRFFIETHLRDEDLSPDIVASEHFVSVRKLQYLFQEHGETISGYIRKRRLERSRLDLMDPALVSLPIHQIAFRWGFSDAAHFSRQFKAAYGVAPKDYRPSPSSKVKLNR